MTDTKRTTISLPDELIGALEELKKTEEFKGLTYSELIRLMLKRGLAKVNVSRE